MPNAVVETSLEGLKLLWRGKVRDVYDLGERLLVVATDRISAFDVVLPTPVPEKGKLLTQVSASWFKRLSSMPVPVEHHLVSTDVSAYPEEARRHRAAIEGRSMLVKKARRVDVECVVRGYLAGSAFKEYRKTGGRVWGHALPAGLEEASELPEPIFTPTTKAEGGAHDEPLTFEETASQVGPELAARLRDESLRIYRSAREICARGGLLLADTKFEFGFVREGGAERLILIDEVLTPDSSRFWEASSWKPGRVPENFDKQFVRDYLESLRWDKRPPGPELPGEVVRRTVERYREVLKRLGA